MYLLPYAQGVKIKPVTMATNKAASLDEELGDIAGYEFGEPILLLLCVYLDMLEITSCSYIILVFN